MRKAWTFKITNRYVYFLEKCENVQQVHTEYKIKCVQAAVLLTTSMFKDKEVRLARMTTWSEGGRLGVKGGVGEEGVLYKKAQDRAKLSKLCL